MIPCRLRFRLIFVVLGALFLSRDLALAAEQCSIQFKGSTKTFDGCRTDLSAGVSVYWTIDTDKKTIATLFTGKPKKGGFVGWGWGAKRMVGSNAAVAFVDPSTKKPRLEDFALRSKSESGVVIDSKQGLLVREADIASDGTIKGYFVRPLDGDVKEGTVSAIWAVGPSTTGNVTLSDHESSKASGDFNLERTGREEGGGSSGFEGHWKFHGVLLAITWFLLVPTGIIWMRYLKKYNPLAFQVHRAIMVTVLLLVLIGFLIGLVKGEREKRAHLSIGSAVMALVVLQVVMGTFRPNHESRFRWIFYIVHSNAGRAAYIAGVINCFIGLDIIDAKAYWFVLCVGAVVLFAAAFILFEFFLKSKFPTKVSTDHSQRYSPADSQSAPYENSVNGTI